MKLSVIIPYKNDSEELTSMLDHLLCASGTSVENFEVIVVNDGSVRPDGKFQPLNVEHPSVRVINISQSFGVGASFDRGVEAAKGEYLVLTAADVYPRENWYYDVVTAIDSKPESIGCAVCIGLNADRMDLDHPDNIKRYGADLLLKVGIDDLPENSKLRQRKEGYTELFKAKWLPSKQSNESYEIPCLLGAFYFCTKEYYTRMGGFDTEKGNRYKGHRVYGHLEPHLSLKSWLCGNGCILHPDIEAGHVFSRLDINGRWSKGSRGMDWMWWNALWILETMILDKETRKGLNSYPLPELNLGVARQWIRQNYNEILKTRELNRGRFKNDLSIFENKFGYKIN